MASRRSSKALAVSVPPEAAAEFEQLAGAEGRNKSELFREMLRVYRVYRARLRGGAVLARRSPGRVAVSTAATVARC